MRPHAHQYVGTKSGCVCEGVGLHDALGDDAAITDGQIVLPRPGADLGAGRLDRWRGWGLDVHGWPRPVGATPLAVCVAAATTGTRAACSCWSTAALWGSSSCRPGSRPISCSATCRPVCTPLRSPRRPSTSIILSTGSPALLSPFAGSTDPPIPGSPKTASHLAPRPLKGTDNRDGPAHHAHHATRSAAAQPNQTAERSSCLVTRRRGPATVDRVRRRDDLDTTHARGLARFSSRCDVTPGRHAPRSAVATASQATSSGSPWPWASIEPSRVTTNAHTSSLLGIARARRKALTSV